MRRFFLIFLLMACAMLFCAVFSACDLQTMLYGGEEEIKDDEGDEEEDGCVHSWQLSDRGTAATCNQTGVRIYVCTKCGEERSETIPKTTNHQYENHVCVICGTQQRSNGTLTDGSAIADVYEEDMIIGYSYETVYTMLVRGKGAFSADKWTNFLKNYKSKLLKVSVIGAGIGLPDEAFADCERLQSVVVADMVDPDTGALQQHGSVASIGREAFRNCYALEEIALPQGILSIGQGAFSGCETLTTVSIADTLTYMGKGAFSGCDNMREITLPFAGCEDRSGANVTFGSIFTETEEAEANQSYRGETYFAIPINLFYVYLNGTEAIKTRAFGDCKAYFEQVVLRSQNVEEEAFFKCAGLRGIVWQEEGCFSIGKKAFYDCSKLTAFTVPAQIETIPESAFEGCNDLVRLVFTSDSRLNAIDASAFRYCSSLNELDLPETLRRIGAGAFSYCSSVSKIVFNEGLETVGNQAFMSCSNLTDVYLPCACLIDASDNSTNVFQRNSAFSIWVEDKFTVKSSSYIYKHYTCPANEFLSEYDGRYYKLWNKFF